MVLEAAAIVTENGDVDVVIVAGGMFGLLDRERAVVRRL